MEKREKPKREKSALERVPTRKLIAMVKQDIRRVLHSTASTRKPKKK
jgi:hypothetical protein